MPRDLDAPAVVIAHGAWADATSWREVIALLQIRGLRVVGVQNPLTGLADDVDAVTRALNHQAHPVVLVGHDYGGAVITQAGRHRAVAALVYIAAVAPEIGESAADGQGSHGARAGTSTFTVDAGGFLYLAPTAVLEFLAHDLTATEAAVLAAAQKPIRVSALRSSHRRRLAYEAFLVWRCRRGSLVRTRIAARDCPTDQRDRR